MRVRADRCGFVLWMRRITGRALCGAMSALLRRLSGAAETFHLKRGPAPCLVTDRPPGTGQSTLLHSRGRAHVDQREKEGKDVTIVSSSRPVTGGIGHLPGRQVAPVPHPIGGPGVGGVVSTTVTGNIERFKWLGGCGPVCGREVVRNA